MNDLTDVDAVAGLRRSACLCDDGATNHLMTIAVETDCPETPMLTRHDAIIGGEVHL